jgi:hypothetical protein
MPEGALGPIIKPMDWRRHNDSKLFTRDWSSFIWPLKIRRRILMAYRQALIEREKNQARKWWFYISKYERDCWIGRRADGEFPNIAIQAGFFKGPKRQRGNFSMFPIGIGTATSFSTLGLASTSNLAINIDFSPPGPLDAGFGVLRDGTHDRINSSGQSQINSSTDWITPRNSTVGDDYEVIWNQLTGTNYLDENYTEDTWTTIDTVSSRGRYVGDSRSTASQSLTHEIDIGDDGTSTSDINQDYSVEAGEII